MTQLEITKINETKNFLNFKEKISDLEICLMKEDYKRALTRFMYWKKTPIQQTLQRNYLI